MTKNLILIGYMGVGKSSVAAKLAKILEISHFDTDDLIEHSVGTSIYEIFSKYGEDYFRNVEAEVIQSLSKKQGVFSVGGGAILRRDNIDNLKQNGIIILLTARATTIYKRLKNDYSRPLLANNFSVESIESMMNTRGLLYNNAADIIINTENKSINEVVSEIMKVVL